MGKVDPSRVKTDSNGNKYIVVIRGDTLSEIARDVGNGVTTAQLGKINNLDDINLIIDGQKIYLTGSASSSSSSTTKKNTNQVTVKQFGLIANPDATPNTLFVSFDWTMHSTTDHYEVLWEYQINTSTGTQWFEASKTEDKRKYSTCAIPSGAIQIHPTITPIAIDVKDEEGKVTGKKWKATALKLDAWVVGDNPYPGVPPTPSINTDDLANLKITASVSNIDLNADSIEFQVIKDNTTFTDSVKATIDKAKHASAAFTLTTGSEYKVRCRAFKKDIYSKWSDFTDSIYTIPPTPAGFTSCYALKKTADGSMYVYLEWKPVNTATSYDVEYTTDKAYFDNPTGQTTTITVEDGKTKLETYGLDPGAEYFFRLRAKNSSGDSKWSGISSVTLGQKPDKPTTWSSANTATVGGPLKFYWVHNSKDGSSQTYGKIQIEEYIGGSLRDTFEVTIQNTTDPEEKDKTSVYSVDTSQYAEGAMLKWRVCTSGVSGEFGEWSIVRQVDIYAKPTLDLSVTTGGKTYKNGSVIEALTGFPIAISTITSPSTQKPVSYHLSIVSNNIYDTVDNIGNNITINKGENVYSRYFDVSTDLETVLMPSDVDLENNMSYTIICTVAMDSGLSAEARINFTVKWVDTKLAPNATIVVDRETLVTHIRPYCEEYSVAYYKVNYDSITGKYTSTNEALTNIAGTFDMENAYTTDGKMVLQGYTDITINDNGTIVGGDDVFCYMEQVGTLVEGVTLSVYRREFDGSFTEIGSGLDNTSNTFVTDPHPALDYARYRIVATTNDTGAVSYYDMPGHYIGEYAVIIQWDEQWSMFEEVSDDPMSQPPWSGSLLRLPYNIDISDNFGMDLSAVKYIGRKRPVVYYGTQLGETSSWSVVIPKSDEETLYAIRRLAIWTGNAYVREPSGSGYWANVNVSFSQKHNELTIPVSFSITRVEGGM